MHATPKRDRGLAAVAIAEGVLLAVLTIAWLRGGRAADAADGSTTAPGERFVAVAEHREDHPDAPTVPHEPSAEDSVPGSPAAAPPPAAAPMRTVVYGEVLDAKTGFPLPGQVQVTLQSERDDKPRSTATAADAADYAFPGVDPGAYRLSARVDGYRETGVQVEIAPGQAEARVDLSLEPTWILFVRVQTPDGESLQQAISSSGVDVRRSFSGAFSVLATDAPLPPALPLTDRPEPPFGRGIWRSALQPFSPWKSKVPAGCDGYLEMPTDQPFYVSAVARCAALATERVEPGQLEVTLVVPLATLQRRLATVRLRLVDPDGQPLAGKKVCVTTAQSAGGGVDTDDGGRVAFAGLLPGQYEVDLWGGGLMCPPLLVAVPPGADLDLGDVPARPGAPFVVQLRDAPPDAEVSMSVLTLDTPLHSSASPRTLHIGTPRNATAERSLTLYPGRYLVTARGANRCGEVVVNTAAGGPFPLTMVPASKLRIVPAPFARELELRDAAGRTRYRQWLRWLQPFLQELPPGTYTAIVRDLDGSAVERPLLLGDDVAELDLRVQ